LEEQPINLENTAFLPEAMNENSLDTYSDADHGIYFRVFKTRNRFNVEFVEHDINDAHFVYPAFHAHCDSCAEANPIQHTRSIETNGHDPGYYPASGSFAQLQTYHDHNQPSSRCSPCKHPDPLGMEWKGFVPPGFRSPSRTGASVGRFLPVDLTGWEMADVLPGFFRSIYGKMAHR
jgi:hypothetical protein